MKPLLARMKRLMKYKKSLELQVAFALGFRLGFRFWKGFLCSKLLFLVGNGRKGKESRDRERNQVDNMRRKRALMKGISSELHGN